MHTDVLKRTFPKSSGAPVVVDGGRRALPRAGAATRRLALALLAPLGLVGLAVLIAATATPSAPAAAPVVTQRTLSMADGYPAVGGTAVTVVTGAGGPSAGDMLTLHTTVTGHPTASRFTFTGTATGGLDGSTLRSTFTGTATRRSDGSLTIVDRGRFGGGTYALTCSMPAGSVICSGPFAHRAVA